MAIAPDWWRTAVIYQVYPRSFADSNGDGIGDLPGVTSRLGALEDLGVDAIWLSPFMTSPQNDAGYDVADYCDVDPLFGTLADFDAHAGCRPRPGPARDHRPGAEPQLERAPAGSRRRSPPGRDHRSATGTCSARAPASSASCRRTTGSRCSADPPGPASPRPTARPAPGTCTSSTPRSPTSTGRTRGCRSSSAASCASGSTAASTVSASTSPTASSQGRRPARLHAAEPGGSMGGNQNDTPYWAQPGVHEIYRDWHKRARRVRPRSRPVRRGVGRSRSRSSPTGCAPTRCTRPSTSATSRRRGRPRRCARSSTSRWLRSAASARRAPGCSRTTT